MNVRIGMRSSLVAAVLFVVALANLATLAGAEAPGSAAEPDPVLRTATFYSGSVGRTGTFPGTLVCLACDVDPGSAAKAQCEKDGHRHALRIDGDPLLHPLLTSNEEILAQVNSDALHGKTVEVSGVYYPQTGAILVSGVREKS